jgi:ribonuclease R/exosome complex exonuclease DIS3/RRP44
MTDDNYYFDQETLQLIGRRNKRTFGLGDDVMIEIKDANLFKKQLDFLLIND